jgi:hypothetical protein
MCTSVKMFLTRMRKKCTFNFCVAITLLPTHVCFGHIICNHPVFYFQHCIPSNFQNWLVTTSYWLDTIALLRSKESVKIIANQGTESQQHRLGFKWIHTSALEPIANILSRLSEWWAG